jgi:pyrroloquinoline quinone biosynthesis protein B
MRDSPISAVVLTGAEVDQVAGLLSLRERQNFTLYGPQRVLETIFSNTLFSALNPESVTRETVTLDAPFQLPGGVEARMFASPGKVPLYLENAKIDRPEEFNTGLELTKDGRSILFVPGAASLTQAIQDRAAHADLIFFDGTLFTDDEMIRMGASAKTGRRMGHMPITGDGGSISAFNGHAKRVYLHINNTNPILIEGSPENRTVKAAGWDVGYDGMEFSL